MPILRVTPPYGRLQRSPGEKASISSSRALAGPCSGSLGFHVNVLPLALKIRYRELSGDKGSTRNEMEGGLEKEERPGRSLVRVVKEAMGGISTAPNWLQYQDSKFANMREEMPS
jgi:hypothetical protein